ncbi:NUDIX domain-containing protein [Haloechinothrix sp. LS1_15]|nr:NUDIX domain-containing protein [Haloechinothrix sp. LS1_15]
MPPRIVVGAALVRAGAVLAARRSHPAELAGYWELPGGRVELGESETDAVRRELGEELALDVSVGGRLGWDVELAPDTVLRVYRASLADPGAEPVAREHAALRWVGAGELDELCWLPADRAILPELRRALRGRETPDATGIQT